MKRTLLTVIFIFLSLISIAQVFSTSGYVFSDTDKAPIFGVTVLSDEGRFNTLTNEEGFFSLENIPSSTKEIRFVLLGFQSKSIAITDTLKQVNLGNIHLSESQSKIDEVVITAMAPIAVQKGDTIQYNATAFKANPDADADDLLAKMPGMVIQDGKVEAHGEEIKKVYVDGRPFFSDDPMEALSSIPADAIESIQIFDEVSDEESETGVSDSEPTKAINIVTKSKRETNTIMKLSGSAGATTTLPANLRYLAGGNVSYFGKTDRITVTGIANNVNSSKFGSNSDPTEENLDAYGNTINATQGIKITEGIGVNYSRKVDKYQFSASYLFNDVKNIVSKNVFRDYYSTDSYDTRTTDTENNSISYSTTHKVNMRIQYKINDKNTITFSPEFKYQSYNYINDAVGSIVQDSDSLSVTNSTYDQTSTTLNLYGNLIYSHSFEKKGRKASLSASYSSKISEWSRVQLQTAKRTYSTSTGLWTQTAETSLSNKLIEQYSESNSMKFKATWSEPIIENHNLVLNAVYNKTFTGLDKTNDSYDYDADDYSISNDEQYSQYEKIYSSYGGGATYSIKTKNLTLNGGLTVLFPTQDYLQTLPEESIASNSFVDYQPYLWIKYKIYKKINLRVYYKGSTIIPDVSLMQEVINDNSTSNLKIGNPDLENGYKHQLSLYLSKTNVEKSTTFSTSLSATTISNYITTSTALAEDEVQSDGYLHVGDMVYLPEDGALVTRRINMDGYFWGKANVGYSFTAKPLKSNVNLGVGYAYVRTPSFYYEPNYSNVHSASVRIGLVSNISKNIDFNISSLTSYNLTDNTVLSDYTYLNQTFHIASNFILGESWVINGDITWKYYQGMGNYWLLNIGVGKKFFKQKNGEVRLTVYDLLNQSQNIQRYSRTSYLETITSNTLGRYAMLQFSYKFNTMSMPPKPKKMDVENAKDMSVDQLKANQELINQENGTTK